MILLLEEPIIHNLNLFLKELDHNSINYILSFKYNLFLYKKYLYIILIMTEPLPINEPLPDSEPELDNSTRTIKPCYTRTYLF